MPKRKTDALSMNEKVFAQAYTDVNSETLGNATLSHARAYPRANANTSKTEGSRILARPRVQNEIARIFDSHGAGIEVCGKSLSDILHSDSIGTTITEYDKETGRTVQRHGPSHTAVIKAVDVALKASGVYQQQQAAADVMAKAALDQLMDKFLPSRQRGSTETGGGGNGTSGGGV